MLATAAIPVPTPKFICSASPGALPGILSETAGGLDLAETRRRIAAARGERADAISRP